MHLSSCFSSALNARLLACCWRSSGLDSSISNEHLTITYLLASWAIPLHFLLWLPLYFFIAALTEVYHILCSSLFSNVRLIKAQSDSRERKREKIQIHLFRVHSFKSSSDSSVRTLQMFALEMFKQIEY